MFRVVIPARHASARLPGKVLLPIGGKPMLQWVYERACGAGAREVLIATDDERIVSAARAFGAEAVLTAASHASGTDRIAEVARTRGWAHEEIVVNVQGDEPLIPPALIGQVAALLQAEPLADIGTLATPVTSVAEFLDPNAVKVVTAKSGRALYFSRAPIPWNRDGASGGLGQPARLRRCAAPHRHLCLSRRRAAAPGAAAAESARAARASSSSCARSNMGCAFVVATASEAPGPDVNTLADLERVSALMTHAQR